MTSFGETIRELRVAQQLNIREVAARARISPAYLSRIERNKEPVVREEVIRSLAKILAADPDVLIRLANSIDPGVIGYLQKNPEAINLVRFIKNAGFSNSEIDALALAAKSVKAQ